MSNINKDALAQLLELRDFLRAEAPGNFPEHIANWGADAIDRFIDAPEIGLERAFGLTAAASRPADRARRFEMAKKAQQLRDGGMSWDEIAEDPAVKLFSGRAVQRLVNQEFKNALIAERLAARLEDSLAAHVQERQGNQSRHLVNPED